MSLWPLIHLPCWSLGRSQGGRAKWCVYGIKLLQLRSRRYSMYVKTSLQFHCSSLRITAFVCITDLQWCALMMSLQSGGRGKIGRTLCRYVAFSVPRGAGIEASSGTLCVFSHFILFRLQCLGQSVFWKAPSSIPLKLPHHPLPNTTTTKRDLRTGRLCTLSSYYRKSAYELKNRLAPRNIGNSTQEK